MTNATLKDPKANSILDFVSIEESGGNYDAYIGHADGSPGTVTTLTISQIYTFQRQLLTDGQPSSAVGRYQIVQRTLNGLVQVARMPLQTVFDASTQDQLGFMLLSNRGYQSWLAGKIDDYEFAHNLSCEWASLPDPANGGKSHYDGVGPNHAGQTLAAVMAALLAAKTA